MIKLVFIFIISIVHLQADNMGSLLFNGNCITCHHPTKSISAPSTQKIKIKYLDAFPNKKDFVEYMSVWVSDPKEETSIMHDAIKKYDLMPQLAFPIETTKTIANYIYKTDFSK